MSEVKDEFKEMWAESSEAVDLGRAAFLIAVAEYPGLDVAAELGSLTPWPR